MIEVLGPKSPGGLAHKTHSRLYLIPSPHGLISSPVPSHVWIPHHCMQHSEIPTIRVSVDPLYLESHRLGLVKETHKYLGILGLSCPEVPMTSVQHRQSQNETQDGTAAKEDLPW